MKSKAVGAFFPGASLPGGADSPGTGAVKGAAEPRRSEPLTARTTGKESRQFRMRSCRDYSVPQTITE